MKYVYKGKSRVLLGGLLILSLIALSVGCSEPTSDASTISGEPVSELKAKVSEISPSNEQAHEDHDMSAENHDHEVDSTDKGMSMGKDGKGMGMHKGMKMKGMSMDSSDKGMSMGKDGKGMGMHNGMKMKDMSMDSSDKGMSMHGMDMMQMMGMMHGDMATMKMGDKSVPNSALPGFPGITHIYHVGATGFFLDHDTHLELSEEQKLKLEAIKQKSEAEQMAFTAKIEEAEKEIWSLTGSDEPEIDQILEKVKESESIKTEKRLGFIRSVGEAAGILSAAQREQLVSPDDADTASEGRE